MVLIQTVSVDAINTALIALQRGQSIVIGGDKGQTVNNINVTNKSEGTDYSEKIKEITKQIETLKETDTALKAEDTRINDRLNALTQLGISDFTFDDSTRELTIELTDGNVYTTIIRPVPFILSLDGNTLVLENEYQREEVELPFILSSEKGVANGVATLDATGRVPYSQLPESAMEFKGEWNASTNTPHLGDGTGTNGDFYICSQGGTVNFGTSASPRNITFYVNDRVIYQGDAGQWKRLPASEVRTVNGQSGDVVLDGEDINYSSASGSPTIKAKIDSVETKAETQSDWGQTDNTKIDYIKNKPNLATVATSGSYNDLTNKPTIPAAQIQSDWEQTDSTKKDFIKNKIPIWITTGSADDNMSPIDSVTNGNTRPVTSNAVYNALPFKYERIIPSANTSSTYPNRYIRISNISTNNTSSTDAITFLIGTRYNRYLLSINPYYTSGERLQLITLAENDVRGSIVDVAWSMTSSSAVGTMEILVKVRCTTTATKFVLTDISRVTSQSYVCGDLGNDSATYSGTTVSAYFDTLTKGSKRFLSFGTPSFNIPRGGTFSTEFIYKQQINEHYAMYMGRATLGADASGGNLYINLDGLDFRNGDKVIGNWGFKGIDISGSFEMTSNTLIWLRKGYSSTSPTTTEGAGQILEFTVFAYKA